jgi:segregation and condensation protein A
MSDEPKPPATPVTERGGLSLAADAGDEASAGAYRVQLPTFEGPLDLLLHLIQEHEIDILNIPIGFVAEKYVEYITLMQEINIDVASEYLVMAATLAHIKSRMLLPSLPDDIDEADAEQDIDPRAELVRRLLEYQKYKQAADQLGGRHVFGRDVFGRGAPPPGAEGTAPLAQLSLFKLIDAFQAVLDRAKIVVDHQIDLERFSITDRINELADVLRARPRVLFEELFEGSASRAELIITFLALLEMTRLRMTRLFQSAPLDPIYVELSVTDDADGESDGAAPAPDANDPNAEHLDAPQENHSDGDEEAI